VEKRPRITAFNDFGARTPSDKPPIQTPAEQARERGEPWPPEAEPVREPTPVGSYPGGAGNGVTPPGPNGSPSPTPPGAYPGGPHGPGFPTAQVGYPVPSGPGGAHRAAQPRTPVHPAPNPSGPNSSGPNSFGPNASGLPNSGPGPQPPNSVPHNYGAPPDWRPATTPSGQSWPPPGHWDPTTAQPAQPPQSWGNGRAVPQADGTDTPPSGSRPVDEGNGS